MKNQIIHVIVKINKNMCDNVEAIEAYKNRNKAIQARDHWNKISSDSRYRIDSIVII